MSAETVPPAIHAAPPPEKPRLRLDYLDGLRGLAALYVVLHHAYKQDEGLGTRGWPLWATQWLEYGHYAVAVFIVLSGYCLMLPIARSADGRLRGGFLEYIRRRARRILPPYYAALLGSLALIALVPGMGLYGGTHWDISLPAFETDVLASHFLLIHNLKLSWMYRINHPMWSVAVEWQIYFLFPLLLLPVWRRFGTLAAVAAGFLIGLGPYFLFDRFLEKSCPWFVGLFALGMAGAAVGFSQQPRLAALRARLPWGTFALLLAGLFAAIGFWKPEWQLTEWTRIWQMDTLAGLATVCLILACTRALTRREERRPFVLRLLEARPAVFAGTVSYSLYLIHAPILALMHLYLRNALPPTTTFLILMLGGLPLSLLLTYPFHLLFERPFMPGHPRAERQAAQAAAVSPAP